MGREGQRWGNLLRVVRIEHGAGHLARPRLPRKDFAGCVEMHVEVVERAAPYTAALKDVDMLECLVLQKT